MNIKRLLCKGSTRAAVITITSAFGDRLERMPKVRFNGYTQIC